METYETFVCVQRRQTGRRTKRMRAVKPWRQHDLKMMFTTASNFFSFHSLFFGQFRSRALAYAVAPTSFWCTINSRTSCLFCMHRTFVHLFVVVVHRLAEQQFSSWHFTCFRFIVISFPPSEKRAVRAKCQWFLQCRFWSTTLSVLAIAKQ